MKLLRNAEAVLTLGPRTPRDKFMQAAGRLRQLDKEQRLVIVGTDEVCRLIADCCAVGECAVAVRHVIEWVHHNTATQNGEARCLSSLPCRPYLECLRFVTVYASPHQRPLSLER